MKEKEKQTLSTLSTNCCDPLCRPDGHQSHSGFEHSRPGAATLTCAASFASSSAELSLRTWLYPVAPVLF